MQYTITGKNIELTEGLKTAVANSFNKVAKAVPDDTVLTVTLAAKNGKSKIEASMNLKGHIIRVEQEGRELYAAIKKAGNIMLTNIRKHKEKLEEKWHAPISIKSISAEQPDEEFFEIEKEKFISLEKLSPEDACLQLEMSDHDFYMFNNEENDKICVVYKRKDDKKYGIIIPE